MAHRPQVMKKKDRHLNVKEAELKVPASHPLRNVKNEEKLVSYVTDRMQVAKIMQGEIYQRNEWIDKRLAGFLYEKDDQEEQRIRRRELRAPEPYNINPELAATQIGRGVTYLLSVFSPDSGMFEAIATNASQEVADAFVALMNNHAERQGYFRQLAIFLVNAFKYNLAACETEWEEEFGPEFNDQGGNVNIQRKRIWHGNTIRAADMYNLYWDPSVDPVQLHTHGEFVGEASLHTRFSIKSMVERGELHNTERWVDAVPMTPEANLWYNEPPIIRIPEGTRDTNPDGSINWRRVLVWNDSRPNTVGGMHELLTFYVRLVPSEFGLANARDKSRKQLEIWRLTIANGKYLANAEQITNAHNRLPYNFARPVEDNLETQTKSIGEILLPLQTFGAFLLNTHMAATRRNIWNLTVYDPSMIDLRQINDDVAARIPVNPGGYGKNISEIVKQFDSNIDTRQALQDFEKIVELMEFFFPTQMLRQVADLQRATQHQSAAVVQAGHRDLWKFAKVIDDQAFKGMRFIMHSNILQFQESLEIANPNPNPNDVDEQGQPRKTITIDPSEFRKAGIEYTIGDGLKGLDKMTIIQHFKELLNAAIQTSANNPELDIPGMLDYWSSMIGIRVDLTQFRKAPESINQLALAREGQLGLGQATEGAVNEPPA